MELSLPFGPWKEIASADWNGVPTGFYVNQEKEMLVMAFSGKEGEKEGKEKPPGVLILLLQPILIEGNAEKFLESQKRDLTFIEKTAEKQKYKFLLLQSQPFFVNYKQEELARAVKEEHDELDSLLRITQDVAGNYGCRATPLGKCDDSVAESFYGDPLSMFTLGSAKMKGMAFAEGELKKVLMGFSQTQSHSSEAVEIPITDLAATVVISDSAKMRLAGLQVILENLVLAGVPCIVITQTHSLEKMQSPNPNADALAKHSLSKPTGFPLKAFQGGRGFFIDLKFISPSSFCKAFGVRDLLPVFEKNWGESGLSELEEKIAGTGIEGESGKYASLKAVRLLKVLKNAYNGVFGQNNAAELKNPWADKAGRILLVEIPVKELHDLAAESILKSVVPPRNDSGMVAFVFESDATLFSTETKRLLDDFEDNALAIFSADAESSVRDYPASAKIEFLNQDAVLTAGGEKKRFVLRPSYSQPVGV